MIGLLALPILLASAAPDALASPWAHWKYFRPIAVQRRSIATVVVPPSIYANAQPSLGDLRVVTRSGTQVPFAIETPQPVADDWKDAILTDRGFVQGSYSQAVANLGTDYHLYNALDISTPLDSFTTRVDVDASDDGRIWRTVRTGAPIYDYERDGLATNTRVSFPESTARFLRVRVLEKARAFPISGVRIVLGRGAPPESSRYAVRIDSTTRDSNSKTTTLTLMGLAEVPIDRVRIDSASPRFVRTVDLQSSEDGASWQTVQTSEIRRVEPGHDSLSIDFAEAQARRWRVVVHDGDNAPLSNVSIGAYGAPRRIYFDTAPGESYRLIYGNPAATVPSFDYAETHPKKVLNLAGAATLGAPAVNAAFVSSVPQKPWSDSHPWVIWATLGVAVLGIGTMAIRTMTQQPPS